MMVECKDISFIVKKKNTLTKSFIVFINKEKVEFGGGEFRQSGQWINERLSLDILLTEQEETTFMPFGSMGKEEEHLKKNFPITVFLMDGWLQGQESPEEIFSGEAGAREWKVQGREGACKRIKCSAANPLTDENIATFQRSIVSLPKCKSQPFIFYDGREWRVCDEGKVVNV